MRDQGRVASAWIASVVGHLTLLGLSGLLLARSLGPKPAPPVPVPPPPVVVNDDTVEIELPKITGGSLNGDPKVIIPPTTPETMPRGGGEAQARLDQGRAGKGGTDTSEAPAENLADRDDKILMSPDVMSRFERSQIQRIKTARERTSREDMRASREPMELTFLAQGATSDRPERRKASDSDPSNGAMALGRASNTGSPTVGGLPLPEGIGDARRDPGGEVLGSNKDAVGSGVRDGAPGLDHRDSAKTALARPMVQQGVPSVPSNKEGHPNDTLDSEQEVATKLQSIIHASTAGGPQGPGTGGENGSAAPGAGGVVGAGSNAKANGTGKGPGTDVDPNDKRRTDYLRKAMSRIGSRCIDKFPKWAAAEGLQGTVIVSFTIRADGSISPPSVSRPSGIPEFDENCRKQVAAAAPFAPLPAELGATFRWALPFHASNAAVLPPRAKNDD